jgi:dTDP-4-amino-4,6-dideoxygalactose transaminase
MTPIATNADTRSPRTITSVMKSPVPFLDLGAQFASIRSEALEALCHVAESGSYVLGPRVAEFEEAFAAHVGARYCVGLNSGTSALHLALICAGVRAGDEVVTVPMTFIATTWAISYIGAKPVFVDVEPVSYTMDARLVEERITSRTRAIVPVHLYGQPAHMDPILEIAERRGIPVVEDAAQAHGALYHGRGAGTLGFCGCYSFYPGKNLGACGEAGAVVTDDPEVAERLRALRDHAQSRRYHHAELGFNYRMDAFQGAILNVKLKHLPAWTDARRRLAERYRQRLAGLPLELPTELDDRRHVWHLFVVLHPRRDRIRAELEVRGIQTGLHYPVPVHLQDAYSYLEYRPGDFPVSERVASACFTLPLYPEMTDQQQDQVIEALQEVSSDGDYRGTPC